MNITNLSQRLAIITGVASVFVLAAHSELFAASAKVPPPPPEFSVAVNESSEVDVYRGWPIIVEAQIFPPDTGVTKLKALVIAAASGPWSGAIQFDVQDDQNQSQAWPFHLVNTPDPFISIGAKAKLPKGPKVKLPKGAPKPAAPVVGGDLLWYLTPNKTSQLATGVYTMAATLTSTNATNKKAWAGQVAALPIIINVLDEPGVLSSDQLSQKYQLLAEFAHIQGDDATALTQIDQLLAVQTNDVAGLAVKAALLESSGQANEAIRAYSEAIDANRAQNSNTNESPGALLVPMRDLITKVLNVK